MRKFVEVLIILFAIIGLVSFLLIVFSKAYFNTTFVIDPELASKFGEFFGGYVGTLFSVLSVLLIIYTIINQNIENRKSETENKKNEVRNHFFKMVDYHNENVRAIFYISILPFSTVRQAGLQSLPIAPFLRANTFKETCRGVERRTLWLTSGRAIYSIWAWGNTYSSSNLILKKSPGLKLPQ